MSNYDVKEDGISFFEIFFLIVSLRKKIGLQFKNHTVSIRLFFKRPMQFLLIVNGGKCVLRKQISHTKNYKIRLWAVVGLKTQTSIKMAYKS